MNLTIGFCSKQYNQEFIDYLTKIFGEENQIICKVGSVNHPICQCYNEIIAESQNDIIVLCHDDIEFVQMKEQQDTFKNLILKLFKFSNYGILGVIGGIIDIETSNSASMRRWYEGHLIQYKNNNTINYCNKLYETLIPYTYQIHDVFANDGLLLMFDKRRIKYKFDENNKSFHFYDIDFCFSNWEAGIKIGSCKTFLVKHKSEGVTDINHDKVRQNYFTPKWKHLLQNKEYHNKLVWVLHTYNKDMDQYIQI